MDHGPIYSAGRVLPKTWARPFPQPRFLVTFYWSLLVAAFLCAQTSLGANLGQEHRNPKQELAPSQSLRYLETQVWTETTHELDELEKQVASHIQRTPNSPLAHAIYSHLLLRKFAQTPDNLHLIRAASEMAQQAVDLDPTHEAGFVSIADVLDVMSQNKKALQLMQQAVAKGMPAGWRTHFTIARLSANTVPLESVLSHLRRARNSRGVIAEVIDPYVIAVLRSIHSGEQLEVALIKWNNEFPSATFQNSIAQSMTDRGQFNASHKLYQEILRNDPNAFEPLINDGILLYKHLNKAKDAKKSLQLALKNLPSQDKYRSLTLLHLANVEMNLRNPNGATPLYLESVTSSKDPVNSLVLMSRSLRADGHLKKLNEIFQQLSRQMAHVAMVHALHGELLSEDLQQYAAAISAFENAVLLEPERADFYNGLGLTYYRMRNLSEALKNFSTAVQIDPSDAVARYNEACVLARIGKVRDALDSLREAVSLDPKLIDTARVDMDFASMRSQPDFIQMTTQEIMDPLIDAEDDLILGH